MARLLSAGQSKDKGDMPEESIIAQLAIDNVKVERLVREFLTAQSLTILPQNSFGDAVSQFVDKDDKHAMEMFVNESLANQIKHLMEVDQGDEEELQTAMDQYRSKLEELFAAGRLKKAWIPRAQPTELSLLMPNAEEAETKAQARQLGLGPRWRMGRPAGSVVRVRARGRSRRRG